MRCNAFLVNAKRVQDAAKRSSGASDISSICKLPAWPEGIENSQATRPSFPTPANRDTKEQLQDAAVNNEMTGRVIQWNPKGLFRLGSLADGA